MVKNLPSGAQVTLVNRTRSKSKELGMKYGYRVADFEDIESEIALAYVIISSIVVQQPFFTKEKLARVEKYAFKYLIDLSVPVSVSPEVEEIARSAKKLPPGELEKLELITGSIRQKTIKQPVLQLKAACQRGEAESLIGAMHDHFDLEELPDVKKGMDIEGIKPRVDGFQSPLSFA